MDEQLWSDEKILQALTQFADENGQIVFSEAAWPVLRQVRDEMQERINQLEREAEALAQGYREILAELQEKEDSKAGKIDMEKWRAFGEELRRKRGKEQI